MDCTAMLDAFKKRDLYCPLAGAPDPVQNRARSNVVTKINKKERLQ
jgi:hypothetical protein